MFTLIISKLRATQNSNNTPPANVAVPEVAPLQQAGNQPYVPPSGVNGSLTEQPLAARSANKILPENRSAEEILGALGLETKDCGGAGNNCLLLSVLSQVYPQYDTKSESEKGELAQALRSYIVASSKECIGQCKSKQTNSKALIEKQIRVQIENQIRRQKDTSNQKLLKDDLDIENVSNMLMCDITDNGSVSEACIEAIAAQGTDGDELKARRNALCTALADLVKDCNDNLTVVKNETTKFEILQAESENCEWLPVDVSEFIATYCEKDVIVIADTVDKQTKCRKLWLSHYQHKKGSEELTLETFLAKNEDERSKIIGKSILIYGNGSHYQALVKKSQQS
jgi:translation initiation factor 1 (eIF-1/SUI1)